MSEELEECPICGDELLPDGDIYSLSCNHKYHKQCIMLEIKSTCKHNYKCPYCRTPIENVPLFKFKIPVKGVHKEYDKYKDRHIPYQEFKQFLDTRSETMCCQALLNSNNTVHNGIRTFFIYNNTRQCARKKMKNSNYFCSIHNKKYNDLNLNNVCYYFP